MTLATGTRLGPFEILSTLSAGGMGEVYRARDTRRLKSNARTDAAGRIDVVLNWPTEFQRLVPVGKR
jgi:serine/threonine protein kinase